MTMSEEQVVLLSPAGTPIGTANKATAHTTDTQLHLAFSCHLLDSDGRILVTRRALSKLTWPGVWTNSFCGHPAPGEAMEEAVARRAHDELGVSLHNLTLVLPDFRYRAVDASGIVVNEVCPVYRATITGTPLPHPNEVMEWHWVKPSLLLAAIEATPWAFSPWLTLQLPQLYPLS